MHLLRIFTVILAGLISPGVAIAQSSFSPEITVNSAAITGFEIDQRVRFLKTIGTPGDLLDQAREALVEERLMWNTINAAGIKITDEAIDQEIENFISRGSVSLDDFTDLLNQNGVEFSSFRRFSEIRATWREFVLARFVPQVNISEDEIDRALGLSGGGLRVLLSEIILPANEANQNEVLAFARDLKDSIRSNQDFERAARRYSAGPSRADNGRLDWLSVSDLPPNVGSSLIGMTPGEVSQPIPIPRAVVLFQMRAIAENRPRRSQDAAIDYIHVRLNNAGSKETSRKIADIRATTDTCNDIWVHTDDLPEEMATRQALAPDAIPTRIRGELGRLDADEMSTGLTSPDGSQAYVIMLCGRSPVLSDDTTRADVMNQLRNQRIEQLAESFLAELRAAAQIDGL